MMPKKQGLQTQWDWHAYEFTETVTAHTRPPQAQSRQNQDKEMALLNNDSLTRKFIYKDAEKSERFAVM